MARLAIAKAFLAEYAKLDTSVQDAVDAAVARLAKHAHPGQHLEKPANTRDDRIRFMRVDTRWRGIVLTPATGAAAHTDADTYCLVTLLPRDKANAYATSHQPPATSHPGGGQAPGQQLPGQHGPRPRAARSRARTGRRPSPPPAEAAS